MQHYDDIGASGERRRVAGFLITAISAIAVMADRRDAQPSSHLHRRILARIIGEDDVVDDVLRNFVEGPFQRLSGVVGRQHHCDFVVRDHRMSP